MYVDLLSTNNSLINFIISWVLDSAASEDAIIHEEVSQGRSTVSVPVVMNMNGDTGKNRG